MSYQTEIRQRTEALVKHLEKGVYVLAAIERYVLECILLNATEELPAEEIECLIKGIEDSCLEAKLRRAEKAIEDFRCDRTPLAEEALRSSFRYIQDPMSFTLYGVELSTLDRIGA